MCLSSHLCQFSFFLCLSPTPLFRCLFFFLSLLSIFSVLSLRAFFFVPSLPPLYVLYTLPSLLHPLLPSPSLCCHCSTSFTPFLPSTLHPPYHHPRDRDSALNRVKLVDCGGVGGMDFHDLVAFIKQNNLDVQIEIQSHRIILSRPP